MLRPSSKNSQNNLKRKPVIVQPPDTKHLKAFHFIVVFSRFCCGFTPFIAPR